MSGDTLGQPLRSFAFNYNLNRAKRRALKQKGRKDRGDGFPSGIKERYDNYL